MCCCISKNCDWISIQSHAMTRMPAIRCPLLNLCIADNLGRRFIKLNLGGVETGSIYVQYNQGIQPNVPPHTTFIYINNHSSGLFRGLFCMCTYHGGQNWGGKTAKKIFWPDFGWPKHWKSGWNTQHPVFGWPLLESPFYFPKYCTAGLLNWTQFQSNKNLK